MAFAPRLTPENFKSAFTAAQGWGTFSQSMKNGVQSATIELKWGALRLRSLSLTPVQGLHPKRLLIRINGQTTSAKMEFVEGRARIHFTHEAYLNTGDRIDAVLS
jgi:hypothetical protein